MVMGRLARMYATQGKLSEAENLYKQALERDPDELSHSRREIITGYAKLLYEASRFDEANKLYDLLRVDAFAGNKKVTKVQTHK